MADSTEHPASKAPMATVTLWRCSKCSSFISVESIEAVCVTVCPACQHAPLDPAVALTTFWISDRRMTLVATIIRRVGDCKCLKSPAARVGKGVQQ